MSVRPGLSLAVVFVLLTVAASDGWAQVDDGAGAARRVLTVIDFGPDADFDQATRQLIRDSLISTLTRQQTQAAVILHEGDPPQSDRDLTEAALAQGSSAWLSVTVSGSADGVQYRVVAFDLVARKYLFEVEAALTQRLRTRDLARRFWSDVAALLGETLQTVIPGTAITFVGAPGTSIAGITNEPIVLDADGRATRTLINPNYHEYRATRVGFYPLEGVLLVGDDPKSVELEQIPATRHTVGGGLSTLNFPTVSYRYDVVPMWVFAGLSVTSYSIGYSLADRGEGAGIFVSLPLQEVQLLAGGFFLPVDAPLRPYGVIFAGTRIVTATEFFGLDPLSRVQAGVILGAEFPVFRRVLGYVELAPTMLFSSEPELLLASHPWNARPLITQTDFGHVDYERYRVGVRWRW